MGLCGYICSTCFGDFYIWLCRLFGLATVVALWGIAVETMFYGHYLGYYLLTIAILLMFLESVFGINYLIVLCCSVDSRCKGCWDCVTWLDDWKKGVFYLVLSIPCFIHPTEIWLAVIGGIMIILTAVFNIFKTFKTLRDKERKTLAQTPSYDKFEEIHEDIEDDDDDDDVHTITQPGTISIMDDDDDDIDVGDQQEILEV